MRHFSHYFNNDFTTKCKPEAYDGQACNETKLIARVTPDGNDTRINYDDQTPQPSTEGFSCPYLITLQGNEENLIHHLDKTEVLIGSDVTDFKLVASDVLPHHCIIKTRMEILTSENENNDAVKRWYVTINPLNPAAEIRLNRSKIVSKHTLQHGDLISIGKQHLFMYKDPSSHINLINLSFTNSNHNSDNCSPESQGSSRSINCLGYSNPKTLLWKGNIVTRLNYRHEKESEILEQIFNCINDFDTVPSHYSHIPAILLCQCIEHACLNFDFQQKNDLLLKIASTLQSLLLVSCDQNR